MCLHLCLALCFTGQHGSKRSHLPEVEPEGPRAHFSAHNQQVSSYLLLFRSYCAQQRQLVDREVGPSFPATTAHLRQACRRREHTSRLSPNTYPDGCRPTIGGPGTFCNSNGIHTDVILTACAGIYTYFRMWEQLVPRHTPALQ